MLSRAALLTAPEATREPERAGVPRPVRRPAYAPEGVGNRATRALLARSDPSSTPAPAPAGIAVSAPADAVEQQAETVAAETTAGLDGVAEAGAQGVVPAAAGLDRTVPRAAAPPPLPPPLQGALAGGRELTSEQRAPLEGTLGADLTGMRVHTGAQAAAAAASLGARAFTVGSSVVLGAGESLEDRALMAHEATHVLQQRSGLARWAVGDAVIMRAPDDAADDSIVPDWLKDAILDAVRAVPGYQVASLAMGQDLLTGRPLTGSLTSQLEQVLALGPFGPGVSLVLQTCEVLGSVIALVRGALGAHNLTLERVGRDLTRAWDEVSVIDGVDANVAIFARYVGAFVDDVRAAVGDIADQVVAMVRAAVVDLVEPLLTGSALGPLWSLFCKVIGHDPLRNTPVSATTVEIITDFLHLIGKDEALARMTENGTLQETADWLDTQLGTFRGLLTAVQALFTDAWAALSAENLGQLPSLLPALAGRGLALAGQILTFGATLVAQVVAYIKNALLTKLSEYAHQTRGFRLLTVVLGQDPFDGKPVARTAEALIGGFIALLPNGEQLFAQLSESGVIADAGGRIEAAMVELGISTEMITGLFRAIWDSLSLTDLANPIGCFLRIVQQFAEPLGRLVRFATVVVQVVVELILRAMNFPVELIGQIVAGVQQAANDISADPVKFLNNVIAAMKAGFSSFFDHILTHLLAGLTGWLLRGLQSLGITIPSELTAGSVLGLIADVLGLSMEVIWQRLAVQIGPEKVALIRGAIDKLTGAWAFVKDVQERGFVAIWDFVAGQLGNLWDLVLDAAKDWIMQTIVEKAIAKVLSMLDPTGIMAVINSAIAFFNAVQSVIEYAADILRIIKRYVDTIAAIARGDITPGAQQLEGGLAAAIPVAIGFLANQVGLGNLPEKLAEIIGALREKVIAAIDWVIAQALRLGRAVLDALGFGAEPPPEGADGEALGPINEPVPLPDGTTHRLRDDGPGGVLVLHSNDVLVNTIADTSLQALVGTFNAAKTKTARKDAALAIVAWISTHGQAGAPGGSSPFIGDVAPHGTQQPKLHGKGVPLWELTSEHVVPFSVIRTLWEALGTEGRASRGDLSSEDNALTTILIYRGAGDRKTSAEATKKGTENAVRPQAQATGRVIAAAYEQQPDVDTPAGDARVRVQAKAFLTGQLDTFVALTFAMVQEEHQAKTGEQTSGALRNEKTPVPTEAKIKGAAQQELGNADAILDKALADLRPPKKKPVGAALLARGGATTSPPAGVAVTSPTDAVERQAHAVAAQAGGPPGPVPAATGLARTAPLAPSTALPPPLHAALSGGRALSTGQRGPIEGALGADLSGLRVHTGPHAAAASAALGARAFTIGRSVVLGAGESVDDRTLMTHEATHVLQQGGPGVRRQPAPSGPAAGDGYVVELKGNPRFAPPTDLGVALRAAAGKSAMVTVRFGKVAVGQIPVYWGTPQQPAGMPTLSSPPPTGYQTPPAPSGFPAWGIPLTHPAFPGLPNAIPMLWIRVQDSVVTGAMGWLTAGQWADDPQLFKANVPLGKLFGGMGDFEHFAITGPITDVLSGGKFRYIAEDLMFESGPVEGSGRLSVDDESYDLDAALDVQVAGLPAGSQVPVRKHTTSVFDTVFATKTFRFDRAMAGGSGGKLTGSLTGTLSRGSVDVRGTLRYANRKPKITGTVTVVAGSFDTARDAVLARLGPDAPGSIQPADPADYLALTGWGQLDFALNDWLTGNAEVIVHPEGWVTARGELTPTAVIGLFQQRQKATELFSFEPPGIPIAGIPGVGDVRAEIAGALSAYGWIGPGALHDLRLTGLLSNHPDMVNRFDFGGTMSAPAAAGLRLHATVGLSGKFLHLAEVAAAKITATGDLELQLYAEAAALAGQRPSPDDPAAAEYFLKGRLEAAAELLLKLKLGLGGRIALWEPKLDLADRAWSLGSGAAQANFEYVLGRKDRSQFTVDFGTVDFDATKFASAVVRGETLESQGFGGKKQVDTATTSEVAPGPNSPALPAPPSATAPSTSSAQAPELAESFEMLGEPHVLTLDLLGEPDLYMQSLKPTALLGRITRIRKALKKSPPEPDQLAAQLADLASIETQAKQVLDAAAKLGDEARYLTPSVPGFRDLARLIAGYAVRFRATDLEATLAAVSVDPTKPETVLNKFPGLAADAYAPATVSRILAHGVPATTLRKIVDHHQPREQDALDTLLLNIDQMMAHNVEGWDKVINELAVGGNMLRGASWVLRYIADFGSWTDLMLEVNDPDAANPTARRWDAWMSGKLYEFKWWYAWTKNSTRTFLRQILKDYETLPSLDIRWVFGPSPLGRKEILQQMTQALDTVKADLLAGRKPLVDGYGPAVTDLIKSQLEIIVVKVKS